MRDTQTHQLAAISDSRQLTISSGNELSLYDARLLHRELKIKTRFNDWIKNRIQEYGFIEAVDFFSLTKNLVSGGLSKEYNLTLDMCKELAMVEKNEIGRQVRRRFIQIEKDYRKLQAALLTGYDEMDKLLAKCKTRWHEGIEWYPATQLRRLACKSYCNQQRYHALAAQGHCIKLPTGLQDRWYVKKEAVNELLYVKANTHLSVSIVNLIHTNY